ncbi:MAG: hypothetical protein H6819_04835 [Phycisphaerales bacterium]|nr:hypothetical protein [Phycisphaerales bacterium]MCB9856526.1 hypothetical protein [Phycisphaerales bacterium]
MMTDDILQIELSNPTTSGTVTVIAKRGDEILLSDRVSIMREKTRRDIAARIAERAGCDAADVDAVLLERVAELAEPAKPASSPTDSRSELLAKYDAETDRQLADIPGDIREDAEATLRDPCLIDRLMDDFDGIGIVGERVLSLTLYVIGCSRLLNSPLSCVIQGLSSSGKSYALERIGRLFPELAILRATDLTPNALYYLKPGALLHRFVIAGERSRRQDDETAEKTRALREILSAGELCKMLPQKESGSLETVTVWQPGPIAYAESTTLGALFDEDANRLLLLATDEQEAQTRAVIDRMGQAAADVGNDGSVAKRIIERHHAMQLMLRRVRVVIPYGATLMAAIPSVRTQARRAAKYCLAMIEAVALLHQLQRGEHLEHGARITAHTDDYVIARRLLTGPLGRSLGGKLTPAIERFGEWLADHFPDSLFTARDAIKDCPNLNTAGKAREYLNVLADNGIVDVMTEGRGSKAGTWRVTGASPSCGASWLPTVDAIQ